MKNTNAAQTATKNAKNRYRAVVQRTRRLNDLYYYSSIRIGLENAPKNWAMYGSLL